MTDLFSSGIQGFGLAPHRAVQERRSDCSWFPEGHCLFRHLHSHGRPGAHQQDGADHPGRLTFPPWTIKSGFPPGYHFLCLRNISGSSRDSLRHGVSSPWWEGHKEGKTVHPLRTGSSARRPERGRGQSLHSSKRGKLLLNCSRKQELIVKMWRFYIDRELQTRHWQSMTQPPGSTNSAGWRGQWAESSASCRRRWSSRSSWPLRPPLMS